MPHPLANTVGVIAALCSMSSFVPQIVKMVRERKAEAVSFPMYVVTVAGFVFWIAYGIAIVSWPVAVSNVVNLILAAAILALKMRFSKTGA
jgi:MtN3 and saliva related transmembrane protein